MAHRAVLTAGPVVADGRIGGVLRRLSGPDPLAVVGDRLIAFLFLVSFVVSVSAQRMFFYVVLIPLGLAALRHPVWRRRAGALLHHPLFLAAAAHALALWVSGWLVGPVSLPRFLDVTGETTMPLAFLGIVAAVVSRRPDAPTGWAWALGAAAVLGIVHTYLVLGVDGVDALGRFYTVAGLGKWPTRSGPLFAVILLGLVLLAAPRARTTGMRLLTAALIAGVTYGLVASETRGGLLGVAAGALIAVVLTVPRLLLPTAGTLAALAAGIWFIGPLIGADTVFRGDDYRIQIWQRAFELAAQSPWLGHGFGTDYRLVMHDGVVFTSAHNILMSAQLFGGLPALLTLVALIVAGVVATARMRRDSMAPLAMFVAGLVAMSVDFRTVMRDLNPEWVLFWLPLAIALGHDLRRRLAAGDP
ncbi:MAG TPA: O-antigen ligase family protein [Azospirillaceae bacterium]|nr:O-antigen ligase family protein [Azospirillaceae bacterium]